MRREQKSELDRVDYVAYPKIYSRISQPQNGAGNLLDRL